MSALAWRSGYHRSLEYFQYVFVWQCSPTKKGKKQLSIFFYQELFYLDRSRFHSLIPTSLSSRPTKPQLGFPSSVKLIEQRQNGPRHYIHTINTSALLVIMIKLLINSSDARQSLDVLENSSDKTSREGSSVAMKTCSTIPLLGFSSAWRHTHDWHRAAGARYSRKGRCPSAPNSGYHSGWGSRKAERKIPKKEKKKKKKKLGVPKDRPCKDLVSKKLLE